MRLRHAVILVLLVAFGPMGLQESRLVAIKGSARWIDLTSELKAKTAGGAPEARLACSGGVIVHLRRFQGANLVNHTLSVQDGKDELRCVVATDGATPRLLLEDGLAKPRLLVYQPIYLDGCRMAWSEVGAPRRDGWWLLKPTRSGYRARPVLTHPLSLLVRNPLPYNF